MVLSQSLAVMATHDPSSPSKFGPVVACHWVVVLGLKAVDTNAVAAMFFSRAVAVAAIAEMVAITKSCCEEMKISATQFELEQIALWAFDLTHAYREVGIQRAEQGRQCVSTSAFKRKLNSIHTRASVPLASHTTSEPCHK